MSFEGKYFIVCNSPDDNVDDVERNLVFGWCSISHHEGEKYIDSNNLWYSDIQQMDSCEKFMNSQHRPLLAEHEGEPIGKIVSIFPMSEVICNGLGLVSRNGTYGSVACAKVFEKSQFEKFKNGEWTGFSTSVIAKRGKYVTR